MDCVIRRRREVKPLHGWLYCDYLAQQEQAIAGVLGAILKQVVGRGYGGLERPKPPLHTDLEIQNLKNIFLTKDLIMMEIL